MPDRKKPKLVFFQWEHSPNNAGARFLTLHMEQHLKCLAVDFEVTVVNRDCDYDAVCDQHEPDLTLFEAGYRSHGSRPIRIANTRTHPGIPKLGLHNGDAWCDRRSGFLSDMDRWGIGSFFSIATVVAEYTPEIWDDVFVWPNFIDPALFHHPGVAKNVDVLLTGQVNQLYPWRAEVFPKLQGRYRHFATPGQGYDGREAAKSLYGADYARALSASRVVPTCGTMGHEVVRKHFEIPAAGSCLVTERTPGLEAAGFIDMENCVFADAGDVVDRLDHLLADEERLGEITRAGHDLVNGRHTLAHRPQIREWLTLRHAMESHQRIVQDGPFGSLRLSGRSTGERSAHVVADGLDRQLLRRGDAHLWRGESDAARAAYARCLEYVSYLPEAHLKLAVCDLLLGNAAGALDRLARLLSVTAVEYGASDCDPVEWSYLLVSLVCKGRLGEVARLAGRYPELAHPELDHALEAIRALSGCAVRSAAAASRRSSVHIFPSRSQEVWNAWLAEMLVACGQSTLANRLIAPSDEAAAMGPETLSARFYGALDAVLARVPLRGLRPSVPPLPEFRYLAVLRKRTVRTVVPRPVRAVLRGVRGCAGRR